MAKSRRGMNITQGLNSALWWNIATSYEGRRHPWNAQMSESALGRERVRWTRPALGILTHPNWSSGRLEKDMRRIWILSKERCGPRRMSQVVIPSPTRHKSSIGMDRKNPGSGLWSRSA